MSKKKKLVLSENLKKLIQKVKDQLDKFDYINWEEGKNTGWSENSLILEGGWDCKYLVYVCEDDKGKLWLDYYDLFEEGEYNVIYDCENEETSTSHRGGINSVKKMLKDLDLIEN